MRLYLTGLKRLVLRTSSSEMTYIVSRGALNSTHSLTPVYDVWLVSDKLAH